METGESPAELSARKAIVTVVTRNYLHYALTLRADCRRWQPDHDFHIILIDGSSEDRNELSETAHVCDASSLSYGMPWKRFAFQYTPFELSCAVKPYGMLHAMDLGYDQVIFLDADLGVYANMKSVELSLQSHSIALSPHLQRQLPADGKQPVENNFLNTGTFNGGLIACRNDEVGRDFLNWWGARLRSECYVDIAKGIFVDQKWLNLVPGLFPQVAILRNPACNAGHWTLSQYPIEGDELNGYFIAGEPLESFHFTNFLPSNPYEFMRSQSRVSFTSKPALKRLVTGYHQALLRNGASRWNRSASPLERMNDGTLIRPEWREAIRRGHSDFADCEDPFDALAATDLIERFRQTETEACKWRGDWKFRLPSQTKIKQRSRRLRNYFRHLAAYIRHR
jgi:hypothetical protein